MEADKSRLLSIRVDSVVQNRETQIRTKGTNSEVVRTYREAMRSDAEFPPIVVVQVDPEDEQRGFILIDGWHRIRAMQELEREHVNALVITEQAPSRYQWLAAKGNREHGLRLSREDKREVFRAYIRASEHRTGMIGRNKVKSARQMAKELQGIVSHKQLPVWMKSDFPGVYRLMVGETDIPMDEDEPFDTSKMRDEALAKEAVIKIQEFKALIQAIRSSEVKRRVYGRAGALMPITLQKIERTVRKELETEDEF